MPNQSRNLRPSTSTSSSSSGGKITISSQVYQSATPTPLEIVTLQYEDAPVFVKRPETYEDALDMAMKEYHALAHLSSKRIGFALSDVAHGGRLVRISESAWTAISAKIPGGTIIHVLLLPDPDEKQPPQYGYLDVPAPPAKDTAYHLGAKRITSKPSVNNLFSWMGVGK